uniref:Uncharacterized protein n=1 Tax=Arundo donax TaxID=35708 RepID=A0A0A8YAM5_ARUDO
MILGPKKFGSNGLSLPMRAVEFELSGAVCSTAESSCARVELLLTASSLSTQCSSTI